MGFSKLHLYILLINSTILLLITAETETSTHSEPKNHIAVSVGVVLDFNSSTGFAANSCISTALSDFYSLNKHYTTRLVLHPKNSNGVLSAASAALELVNDDQVYAIIGPQYSKEATFVAEIGGKSQVPIISFSVTSSSLWPSQNPYFIRTTLPDSSQLECITSLVQKLGYDAVVVLYQDNTDTESSTGFIPSLTDAFQKASIQLSYVIAISSSANESHIRQELSNLRRMQTRVYLVHMTSSDLASRLFSIANEEGIMNNGTAWIITDALSNTLRSLDATTIEAMEGVIGVKPYVPKSKNLEIFKIKRKENNINMLCLRAYDTVWALATSVEKLKLPQVRTSLDKSNASSAAITDLRVSETGPGLVQKIWETRFLGLSGEFKLKDGQLETPVQEIINVVGNGDRVVGYWTSRSGFSRKIATTTYDGHGAVYSGPVENVLKPIIWPGDSTKKPNGWEVPVMGQKLKVGVPRKKGFKEFVNVTEVLGDTKKYNVTGFCIDVFEAALDSLSFKIEPQYIPVDESIETYKDLVNKLSGTKTPKYDALVGDLTIRADREITADFSLPYLESGVVMVVRVEPDRLKNMWIFLKPLSWDLWLTIVLAAVFIGFVLRMLERHVNPQRQLGMLFLFPLAALAFPERNMVGNKWAKFVLVVWLFMAYILMQSYTANLSSILTVSQLRPSADSPACAGYQRYSFVGDMLKKMNIKTRNYTSMEEYDDALSHGCKNGGVDVIFDEIPYVKLFLHKYGSKYQTISSKMDGTATGGFGFAFPTGSPLSKPISKAILDIMEEGKIQQIEKRYFGVGYTFQYHAEDIPRDGPSLTSYSFAGLFTITAFLTVVALVCSECSSAISRFRNLHAVNISRVQSVEMTDYVSSDEDEPQDSKEKAEILGQEESNDGQVVQTTNIHIDHGGE
ncbi:glutamate receptor 2.8-like isoform X1 [Daucus carota subsp. sativus]|uniref:glutamate receptor 2.8-like isoform X1 n=1 Tax=Daucus carota subsp. sativus TaxID=79200 RepID=UPI0007EF8EC7|nr:PREDICTED: glutamate receptor 2.8-like isoform X1 [Daucus carota subsp. sativus]